MIQAVFNEGLKNKPDDRRVFQFLVIVVVQNVFILVAVPLDVIVFLQVFYLVLQCDHGGRVLERVFENIRQCLDDSVEGRRLLHIFQSLEIQSLQRVKEKMRVDLQLQGRHLRQLLLLFLKGQLIL